MSQLNIVASPTSINKVSDHDKVFLWPNPTNHYLHIGSAASPVQQIRCFDAFGKLVSDVKQPGYNTIDITNLAAGIYVAEIKVNNTFQRLKWVKM